MSFLIKSLITSPLLVNPRNGPLLVNNLTLNCLKNTIRSFSVTPSALNSEKCPKVKKANCKMGTCPGQKKGKKSGVLDCPEKKKEKKPSTKPKGSVWDNPECNTLPCPDPYPKFDYLYPKPQYCSKVMQTWVSCPKRRKVTKIVCKYKTKKFPPLPKRYPTGCPSDAGATKTACNDAGNTDLMKCQSKPGGDPKCRKIKMPGCCPARNPPNCRVGRQRNKCVKVKCPWKSFSECDKPAPNKQRPTECGCIDVRPMCEIYMIAKKKGYIK